MSGTLEDAIGWMLVSLSAAALVLMFAYRTRPWVREHLGLTAPTYLVTFCPCCGEDVWFVDSPEVVAHLREHAPDAVAELDFKLWESEPGYDPRGSR